RCGLSRRCDRGRCGGRDRHPARHRRPGRRRYLRAGEAGGIRPDGNCIRTAIAGRLSAKCRDEGALRNLEEETNMNRALLILMLVATSAVAQPYPSKPVRFIVGFPPGGSADPTTRIMGQ